MTALRTDAARRAPVRVHRPNRPSVTGRLVLVKKARCRVLLPSGAYLNGVRTRDVEVIE